MPDQKKSHWVEHDGGRADAGFKGDTGDCFVRSVAIATGLRYQSIYDQVNELAKSERTGKRKKGKSNSRTGVYRRTARKFMESIGWQWVPTMKIGQGCKVHVKADELPSERLVLNLSKHFSTMINGVIYDSHDPARDGTRCVYGYWVGKPVCPECGNSDHVIPYVHTPISMPKSDGLFYRCYMHDHSDWIGNELRKKEPVISKQSADMHRLFFG